MTVKRNYGASYADYTREFTIESHPVQNTPQTTTTFLITTSLLLLAFGSLSMTLLGDVKSKKFVTYLFNSLIALVSIGFSAIYVMNYVGVYI